LIVQFSVILEPRGPTEKAWPLPAAGGHRADREVDGGRFGADGCGGNAQRVMAESPSTAPLLPAPRAPSLHRRFRRARLVR